MGTETRATTVETGTGAGAERSRKQGRGGGGDGDGDGNKNGEDGSKGSEVGNTSHHDRRRV